MYKKIFVMLCMSGLWINNLSFADVIIPNTSSHLNITIYNNDKAFIHDTRNTDIKAGKQKIIYQGVPKQVITQSVIPTFNNIATELYSQNYIYNTINFESMLLASIDTEIKYLENDTLRTGILLAIHPILVRTASGEISTINEEKIIFSEIPKGMITKPSLVWNTDIAKKGKLEIDLKYLTRGISWKSDFVLNLKHKYLDLKGWITIDNDSGTSYNNAQISVIAGDIGEVEEHRIYKRQVMADSISKSSITNESFSGYHLYNIPFKEDIGDKQQKQIAFIDKENIKYAQYGVSVNNAFHNYKSQKLVFNNTIEFNNSPNNNLGIPLPSGVVRMYKNSKSGATHFIGEDTITNVAKNEKVTLVVGKLFDIVGEKKITKYKSSKHYRNIETTYSVRNRGEETVELRIMENIPTYGDNIKLSNSCDKCTIKKHNAFTREFIIILNAGEEYQWKSGFEVSF